MNESAKQFKYEWHPGTIVKVSEGSGIDSGKIARVLNWNESKAMPLAKDYPFVAGQTPQSMNWLAVEFMNGKATALPANRLQKASDKEQAKYHLLTGFGRLEPRDLILCACKRSRTSLTKTVKFYKVVEVPGEPFKNHQYQHLAMLSFHIAKLMGHKIIAGSDAFRISEGIEEFIHYLSLALFGKETVLVNKQKLHCEVIEL